MIFGQFTAAAPEITLLTLICVVLVADLFVKDEQRMVTFWITIASLAITAWSILATAPEGRTVLFVSHDTGAVLNLCQTAVMLNNGTVELIGKPKEVTEHYLEGSNPPATIGPGQEGLGEHCLKHYGELNPDLRLLVGRKNVNNAFDSRRRAYRMQCA